MKQQLSVIRPDQFTLDKVPVLVEDRLWNGREHVPAYIHVSDLTLGPSLGGCRIHHYERNSEAMRNAEQLSWGMRAKSALAGVPYGGGKAVLATDAETGKNRTLLQNFAAMVNDLGGNYITAEDSGAGMPDIDYLAEHTNHVVGTSEFSGNPSPVTAYGTYKGLVACLRHAGIDSFEGTKIALKGAGSVSEFLVYGFPKDEKYDAFRKDFPGLVDLGVEVIYYNEKDGERSDKFKTMARERGKDCSKRVQRRSRDELLKQPVDIYIPSAARYSASGQYDAKGNAVPGDIIDQLIKAGCKIIGGPENTPIADPKRDMARIQKAGIIYGPDYAINAGGLINVHFGKVAKDSGEPFDSHGSLKKTEEIEGTIDHIVGESLSTGKTTLEIANELVEERIKQVKRDREVESGRGIGV